MTEASNFKKLHTIFNKFNYTFQIQTIDFTKPFWTLFTKNKLVLNFVIISEIIKVAFITILPLVLGWIINTQNYGAILYGIIISIVIQIMALYSYYLVETYHSNNKYSLYFQAYKQLLCIDPIWYATGSTGEIHAKIDRAYRAVEDFAELLLYEILPAIVSVVTVLFALVYYNLILGLIALVFICLTGGLSTVWYWIYGNRTEPKINKQEDLLKSASIENLSQISYIRACFATFEQITKLKKIALKIMKIETHTKIGYIACNQIVQLIYRLSLFVLAYFILKLVESKQLDILTGSSLLLTYLGGSATMLWIGQKTRRLIQNYFKIVDLFDFMKGFGKQSFPVLE
jgi:ABC-type bacteriocin/lantibiotic exporter with double-glycine peptidase domain